jgi:hypothetical protein
MALVLLTQQAALLLGRVLGQMGLLLLGRVLARMVLRVRLLRRRHAAW